MSITFTKIFAIVGIATTVVVLWPAAKGPYNRLKNNANEALNDEFVVDNYKAEYIKLHEKKTQIKKSLEKLSVDQAVNAKKTAYAKDKLASAKSALLSIGTADLSKFNHAKDIYETAKTEVQNLETMAVVYSNAVSKLETSLQLVESSMQKAKANVDALSAKKALVENMKAVNETVESLRGVGDDAGMNAAIEKLDENALKESIKLEALSEDSMPKTTSKEAAEEYLKSL